MANQAELLPGTLDLLILKALSLGALHGCGVLRRIGQISGGGLTIEQGSLYPALYRLKAQGVLDSEWGTSVNKRRAKFYRLTPVGRKRLRAEMQSWNRLVSAIATSLGAKAQEVYAAPSRKWRRQAQ
jgi:PadR family transcriptional regulator PadR